MLYCPINALLAMAEALFGELTVLTVILEAEQRHGTTLDGTVRIRLCAPRAARTSLTRAPDRLESTCSSTSPGTRH